jgi:hypothetical protein
MSSGLVAEMERKRSGPVLVIVGVVLLLVSLFVLLSVNYILSLFVMFGSVVLIGIGFAFAKGVDKTLDAPREECYYCQGTGKITSGETQEVCPRCGGTGLARADD